MAHGTERRLGRVGALAALTAGLLLAAPREGRAEEPDEAVATALRELGGGRWLRDRLGTRLTRSWLTSPDRLDRIAAVDRLASLGTPEALDQLVRSFREGELVARHAETRLFALRMLAPHAGRQEVRDLLVREASDPGGRREGGFDASGLARSTAALALAREGSPASIEALARLAERRGPVGESARAALVAAPPRTLDGVLFQRDELADDAEGEEPEGDDEDEDARSRRERAREAIARALREEDEEVAEVPRAGGRSGKPPKKKARGAPIARPITPALAALLGELGDLRAIGPLVSELDRGDRAGRAAVGLALSRLGDARGAGAVSDWLDDRDPRTCLAAAEVYAALGRGREAGAAIVRVLGTPDGATQALSLAEAAPSPPVVAAVRAKLPSLGGSDRARAVSVLARAGAVADVAALLLDEEAGPAAHTALARMPGDVAAARVAEAIASDEPRTRRAGLRVGTLRAVSLGERVRGLEDGLAALARSKDASDHEVATFGLVALGVWTPEAVLASRPAPSTLAAAVRGAALDPDALVPLAPLFAGLDAEAPTPLQLAAGPALGVPEVADAVPLGALVRLAETASPLASLAARAAPRRDDGTYADRLEALLGASDPSVRVGVALGLAESKRAGVTSVLVEAYGRETDPIVRRALVTALGARSDKQRLRALGWARDLDPDAAVRAAARTALAQRAPLPAPRLATALGLERGRAVMLGVAGTPSEGQLRLVAPSGLSIPVWPAPDGALTLMGWPDGPGALELASVAPAAQRPAP